MKHDITIPGKLCVLKGNSHSTPDVIALWRSPDRDDRCIVGWTTAGSVCMVVDASTERWMIHERFIGVVCNGMFCYVSVQNLKRPTGAKGSTAEGRDAR